MNRLTLATALFAAVLPAAPLLAQEKDSAPDPVKLITQAREAIGKAQAMSFHAVVAGEGGLNVPGVSAEVTLVKADAGGWQMYAKGATGTGAAATPFEIAFDGVEAHATKEKEKVIIQKTVSDATELQVFLSTQGAKHQIPWELITEKPLDGTPTYVGTSTVGTIPCDVLMVPPPAKPAPGAETDAGYKVYLSTKDHLPRRIDRLMAAAGQARSLTLESLKLDGEATGADFTMPVPDGFTVKIAETPGKPKKGAAQAEAAGPLAVGDVAPEFSLKDTKGKTHKLSDYKGKVVLLDFWATWCGWCVKAMPGVQHVHEHFKGQDVEVFGINYNENGDPAAFMRKNKFTYGLLLNGEVLQDSYHIGGIPAFFLVGPDGKILWSQEGYDPAGEKKLKTIIQKTLDEMKAKDAKPADAAKDAKDNAGSK